MPNGVCHLCGVFGPLTFEHVPPRAAFNDRGVLEADIYKLIGVNAGAKMHRLAGAKIHQ
jgi:hypothetical protein